MPFWGWLSDHLERLSDLQLGNQKVTLNHLVPIHFRRFIGENIKLHLFLLLDSLQWKIAEPDPWFLRSKSVLTRRLSCFPRACVMCPPPGQDDFLFRGGHETSAFETVRGYAFTIIKGSRFRRSLKDPYQVLLLRLHSMTFLKGDFCDPKFGWWSLDHLEGWWMVYLLKTFVYHHLQSGA